MKELQKKHRIWVAAICIVLSIAIVVAALFSLLPAEASHAYIDATTLSEDSIAVFHDDVKIAFSSDAVEKRLDEITLNESGVYTLQYKRKLPVFFENVQAGEIFCVYPNRNAKEACFQNGFCGKLLEKSTEECTVAFSVPQLPEVFQALKIDASKVSPAQMAFYPSEHVSDISMVPAQMSTLSATGDAVFSIGNTDVEFAYREADQAPILPEYQVLCKQLDIQFRYQVDDVFEIDGGLTLGYPCVKFLLDYETDEQTGEVLVNDYSFDFVSKETVDLSLTGKKDVEPLQHRQDLLDVISPVNIVDVTESEAGKYVLGTFVIGYNVKLPDILPVSLNNTENDVGYLSLGIAFQLAVTANGEIEMSCDYKQSGLVSVSADAQDGTNYMLKGASYPHPVLDSTVPDGSYAQEEPMITSSYQGKMSFTAGISVDVGVCILGMIPIKIANGIEAEMQTEVGTSRTNGEVTVIEDSYIEAREDLLFSVNVYSDLKLHLGVEPKIGGKGTAFSIGSVIQIFRENLIQIPEAMDFSLEQCRIGGVQLGQSYTDDQLASAIADYATKCEDYSLLSYTKDAALNTALNGVLDALDIQAQELLGDWQEEYPNGKLDCYTSGALFVRDSQDVVVAILLFGEDFRNETGLHTGLRNHEIEALYSVPDESYSVEVEVGFLIELFAGLNIDNVNAQALAYQGKDGACRMEVLSTSDTSQIILLKLI